jgi:hypothetical protein
MYQITLWGDKERCLKQAEEIKKMLLWSSQSPDSVKNKHIHSSVVIEGSDSEEGEMDDLEVAMNELDDALNRMKIVSNCPHKGRPDLGEGPNGLDSVPTTHEVIHNHSRTAPHAKFL